MFFSVVKQITSKCIVLSTLSIRLSHLEKITHVQVNTAETPQVIFDDAQNVVYFSTSVWSNVQGMMNNLKEPGTTALPQQGYLGCVVSFWWTLHIQIGETRRWRLRRRNRRSLRLGTQNRLIKILTKASDFKSCFVEIVLMGVQVLVDIIVIRIRVTHHRLFCILEPIEFRLPRLKFELQKVGVSAINMSLNSIKSCPFSSYGHSIETFS
ncbi:uncharacterized protein LOC131881037 [Tigriopus californicus]|uniref:uncharacterized protein LOC131881037 n=1 Tax=Tigriopus californicus TaxID=6832 RepID=UPI0027DA73BB|nr:uncharacterized protein LOC131881037 [Tigriopus californicus]